ncbi:MAG: hypothetical protein MUF35_03280 [Candidatus Nanopelagicales bacterium]|jgi:O-antigen/teichoic acid export membrane protein|nr:hypothetical protein [Candidatus Nanopelagicales bacterium]
MSEPTPTPGPVQPLVLEPVADDGVRAVAVGLVLWLVALVACLLLGGALVDRGAAWWTWTAVSGLLIGTALLAYCVRRARVYREHVDPPRADGRG